jgi:hypothetical protein
MSALPGISHISEKTYEPFDDSMYGHQALTPDQKIQELEQLLQARDMELDEVRV